MTRTLFLALALTFLAYPLSADNHQQNNHHGWFEDHRGRSDEHRHGWNLGLDIAFSQPFGSTKTDGTGIYYYDLGGLLIGNEDKVYPSQYWGTYPMYLFGNPIPVAVSVTNNGPRHVAKIQVIVEAFDMNLDGTNGLPLVPARTFDLRVLKGETKKIDDTFTADFAPGLDSGLDRLRVRVLHLNHDDDDSDEDDNSAPRHPPKVLATKDAIFCPPKFKKG